MEPVYSNENGPTPDKLKVYLNDDIPPKRKINPDKDIPIGDFSYVFASKSKDEFQEIKNEYQVCKTCLSISTKIIWFFFSDLNHMIIVIGRYSCIIEITEDTS